MSNSVYPQHATRYQAVMQPLEIRGVSFRNRVFLSSMGLDMAEVDGRISAELIEFYRGIVAGGVGAVVLSNASVSTESALLPRALKMHDDSHSSALMPLIAEAAAAGAVVGVQLQHYGGQGTTTLTRGRALLTPSGIGCKSLIRLDPRYRVRAMEQADIEQVTREFASAAARSVQAGARFVQLQAANGYLLSSFLSKATNQRDDAYGGDPIRRARLVIDVIDAVRDAVGPDVVLGLRVNLNDNLGPAGLEPQDLDDAIPLFEAAGVDMFEASFCVADTFSKIGKNTPEIRADSSRRLRGCARAQRCRSASLASSAASRRRAS